MKHVDAQIRALRRLLDTEIRVEMIAEPLHVVDANDDAAAVRADLEEKGFDECGVRSNGATSGIVSRDELLSGTVSSHVEIVPLARVADPTTPLWGCLERIERSRSLFILGHDGIDAIVTKADLDKQPARLLMFGLISMIEMVMLGLIRNHYPDGAWVSELSEGRLSQARELLSERSRSDLAIGLDECLQISDKARICQRTPAIAAAWGMSKTESADLFKSLRIIRDNLAHAQAADSGGSLLEVIATLRRGHCLLDVSVDLLASRRTQVETELRA